MSEFAHVHLRIFREGYLSFCLRGECEEQPAPRLKCWLTIIDAQPKSYFTGWFVCSLPYKDLKKIFAP